MGQVQAVWHTYCILTRSSTILVQIREDHIKEHKPSELLSTLIPLSPPPHLRRCPEHGFLQPGRGFLQPGRGFLQPGRGFLQPRLIALPGPKAGWAPDGVSRGVGWEPGQFFWILPLCWVGSELSGVSPGHPVSCTAAALRGRVE